MSAAGHLDILKTMLQCEKVTFDNSQDCINATFNNNHFEIVKIMMADDERLSVWEKIKIMKMVSCTATKTDKFIEGAPVDLNVLQCYIIEEIATTPEIVKFLLTGRKDVQEIKRLSTGKRKLLTYLLERKKFDPSMGGDWFLRRSVMKQDYETIEMLLGDPRVDPSSNNNEAIITAATLRDPRLVKLLLADPRVDPSAQNNKAIHKFYEYKTNGKYCIYYNDNDLEAGELLLQDSRVDPSGDDNSLVRKLIDRYISRSSYRFLDREKELFKNLLAHEKVKLAKIRLFDDVYVNMSLSNM